MKKITSLLMAFIFCGSAFSLYAKDEVQNVASGLSFDKTVSFEADGKKYDLNLTGTALRKKFFVKVYAVGSYLQDGPVLTGDKFDQIINSDRAKQLTLKWLRGATPEQIQNGYYDSFKATVSDEDQKTLESDFKAFVAFFKAPAKKGDEHVLRFIPGGTVEVDINGSKVGAIKNAKLSKDLLGFWFGPKSVVNRDEMVSDIK